MKRFKQTSRGDVCEERRQTAPRRFFVAGCQGSQRSGSEESFHAAVLALGLAAAMLLPGCSKRSSENKRPDLPPAIVSVQTLDAQPRVMTESVVGSVRSARRADLEARLSAQIKSISAVLGQKVNQGDVLAELDDKDVRARLAQAEARFARADQDFQRFSKLLEKEAVSQSQFDEVQAKHRVALAEVQEARSMLAHATILAPFDGVITRKAADVGDLAAPGKPLLILEDTTELQFEAAVPEALIGGIQSGARLAVRISGNETTINGTVAEIAPAADPLSRTFLVKLRLEPEPALRSGLFGRVEVPMAGKSRSILAPASAVLKRGQMEIAFVVTDERAHLRLVKTGARVANNIEILSGIDPGETVVVEGAGHLIDGQPVEVK